VNVDAGLPRIVGGIRAVALEPGATKVWAVGDKGLLVVTADGGHTWEQLKYDVSAGEFRRASSRTATTADLLRAMVAGRSGARCWN